MESATLRDKQIVALQLGRAPRGRFTVATRCPYGYPQVITVYPLLDGKPFPTTFWLTCPFLSKEIDRLEAKGLIDALEARIQADPKLAARLTHAHMDYIEARLRLLSSEDRAYLEKAGMLKSLITRGIGGTADFMHIKCLHLHVAHALARGNPIGEFVLNQIHKHACPPDEVICERLKR